MNPKTKVLTAVLMMLFAASLFATSFEISGNIAADTTWTGVDTVKVVGDIYVNNSITLTIDPGIYVEFQGYYKLDVQGTLLAIGTSSNMITFTAANHSTGWNRIVFDNTPASNDSSKIVYCKLEYGKANIGGIGSRGGAIYVEAYDKVLISHSTFSNNDADWWGGALYCGYSDIEIKYCDFNNNSCVNMGGAMYISNCEPIQINNLIRNNNSGNAGGICLHNSNAVLINNTIVNNSNRGICCQYSSCPVFRNTIIYGNLGGNVYLDSNNEDPNFYYCDIEGGTSGFGGTGSGANYTGDYENCINANPQFVNSGDHPFDLSNSSPCINAGDPTTTTNDVGEYDLAGDPRILNGIIDIGAYEGFISSMEVSGTISTDTNWSGVDTVKVVGDIYVEDGITLTIDPGIYVEFQGHYKLDVQGTLLAIGTSSNIITFTAANHSTGWNRIVFLETPAANDSSKIVYCKLEYGKANTGGNGNKGGAIYVNSFHKVLISHSTFLNNEADLWGGAIYCQSSNIIIEYCDINNSIGQSGGGICLNYSDPVLINNLIRNNNASYGSGIFFNYSDAILINNTIVNNSNRGIWCQDNSDPSFRNTIIYGNSGYEIYLNDTDCDPNFYYCDIEGGTSGFGGAGAGANYTGDYENCINANPQFVNSGDHPFDLLETSPCLNAGDPSTTVNDVGEYDLSGEDRIQNGIIDIGAYESFISPDNFPGYTLDFDGTDDYVSIPDHNSLDITETLTIEAWVNFTNYDNGGGIVCKGTGSGGEVYCLDAYGGNLRFFFRIGGSAYSCTGGNISFNEWHHIVGQFDGSNAIVYIDGLKTIGQAYSGSIDTNDNEVSIGSRQTGSGAYDLNCSGKIDEVRIWNVARSESEIRENMYLTLSGTESGLVSNWQFNEGSDDATYDYISGNNGTLNNMDTSICWHESTIPFGDGESDSQIETTGIVDFLNTDLSMNFTSQTGAEITVTRIDTLANINPTEPDDVFDEQYWIVNRFGTGTFEADLTFTLSEDITADYEANPSQIELYTRESNADTSWVYLTDANSVDAATDEATFNEITEFSQFTICRNLIPDISVDTDSLNFGLVYLEHSKTDTIVISNNGNDTLFVTNISNNNTDYSPDITSCEIIPDDSCNVVITFSPSTEGIITDTLFIIGNDPDEPVIEVILSGEGETPLPDISVDTDTLDFGQVSIEESKNDTITIYNNGNDTLFVTNISNNNSDFVPCMTSCEIVPDDSIKVAVTFSPSVSGIINDTLSISSNDPDEPDIEIILTGEGIPKPPIIALLKHPLYFTLETQNFNTIDIGEWSTPTFTDLDSDGLLDLIIGKNNGCLSHYEQDTENSTSFSYVTHNFNSIDVGDKSTTTFTDIDGDGLLDLIIGKNDGYLSHYEQESENSTSFLHITSNFNSIDVGSNSSPTFTDLDGDGLLDLIIGEAISNLNHYEQNSENSTIFSYVTDNFNSIDVGVCSIPVFTDLAGDGLLDLLIGEYDGNLNHYEQVTENSTSFSLISQNFNSIDVGDRSTPTFTDLDGDGLLDLIIGNHAGTLYHYEQDGIQNIDFGHLLIGNTSPQRSYFIKASDLTSDLNIECPEGFKVSLSENSGYMQNISISPVNGRVSDTLYVRFEPDSLKDYSGNITHTTAGTDAKYIAVSGTGAETDNFPGTALEFDGTDDYVETTLNDLSGSEITIEYWFKGSSTQSAVRQQSGDDYIVAGWNDLHILSNDGGTGDGIPVGDGAEDGNWHHIAMSWKQNTTDGFVSYLDGNIVGQRTSIDTPIPNINSNVFFGSKYGTGEFMTGSLEEIRIWNVARDSIQIRENMHLTLSGFETGLVSYWQFNEGSDNTAYDPVGENPGTLTNMDTLNCWIDSTIPFGDGVSNSQTEIAGTVDFTGTDLSMDFNSVGSAEITVTRIDTIPNINPTEPETVFDSQYWVVNRFGTGTFDADLTFTLSEDLTAEDEANPSQIKLYTRSSNADSNWVFLTDASSIDAATDEATFDGIT
ncbi:MAG: choice-of-anchor D domain-containing protein, partial [Candidatus Cloacimonetes bacterium]|nr:choice-of-anchor D domain-containing protein [Candidatus Cloacimonadota bacterium]